MRQISSFEASGMRVTQSGSMNDLMNVTTYSSAIDDYGDETLAPSVTVSGLPCGISFMIGEESRTGEDGHTQVEYDAIIRAALTVSVEINSTITIVDKQDTSIDKTYKLTGFPEIGPSAQNIFVEEITT